jgi:hypothetical protein
MKGIAAPLTHAEMGYAMRAKRALRALQTAALQTDGAGAARMK